MEENENTQIADQKPTSDTCEDLADQNVVIFENLSRNKPHDVRTNHDKEQIEKFSDSSIPTLCDDVKINKSKAKLKMATKILAKTGVLTSMVMVATLMGFSTGQFYFNVGDTVILIGAAILGPIPAMIAGGIGSFFADLAVYPATMFFSLFIKGVEGLVVGLLLKLINKFDLKKSIKHLLILLAMAFSTALMAAGYFLCQTLFYGTYAAALVALPMDAVQASISTALAFTVLYPMKFIKFKQI